MQRLLAEEDFVRALARHLIGTGDADDLVQDTWLAAVRARPHAETPRSWLATVLRRLASNRRRADSRRSRREQAAQPTAIPAAPSTEAILACEEVRRRVVAAVLALEEPFQRTVVARYYEGLDSAQIAARDGIEVATVRSRLKRGLDRLRERLDAEHHGERAAWSGPLALLGRGNAAPAAGKATSVASRPAKVALAVAAGTMLAWVAGNLLFAPATAAPATSSPTLATDPAAGGSVQQPPPVVRRDAIANATAATTEAPRHLPFPVHDAPLATASVRVVDAATRVPVAGALVRYQDFAIDLSQAPQRGDFATWERSQDLSTVVRQFGAHTQSDANGLATVRVPRFGGLLQAEADGRFGELHVWPAFGRGERVFELALEAEHALSVRVVDAATGAPLAGKMVQVRSDGLTDTLASLSDWFGPSAENGVIRLAVPTDFSRLAVRAGTIGRSDYVVVDVGTIGRSLPEIRCPATGSFTIELRTPSGRRWPTLLQAVVTAAGDARFGAAGYRPARAVNTEPGIYRIPRVETGLGYHVAVRPVDGDAIGFGDARELDVAGPAAADEDVRVTVTAAFEPCVLEATLQLADGAPPPTGLWAEVTGELQNDGTQPETRLATRMACDASGRIGWAVRADRPVRGLIRLYDHPHDTAREPLFRCEWNTPIVLPRGSHDLGTLLLEAPRLVVAGTVDAGARPWQALPILVHVEVPGSDGTWQYLQGACVFPADSGAFAVHAFTDARRVRLRVDPKPYHLPVAPIVVDTGTADVSLRIDRGSELRARVLAPFAYARALACRVAREDGANLPPTDRDGSPRGAAQLVDCDGVATHFLWPALPNGSYRLDVLAPGIAEPLATVTGIRVGDGDADPRLEAIDVRERARSLSISVDPAHASSRPITEARVLATQTRDGKTLRQGMLFDGAGTARLLLGPEAVDLVVAVPGCRLVRVAGFTGSALQVDPEPAIRVRLRLAPHAAERLAGHRVAVFLDPLGVEARAPDLVGRIAFVRPGTSGDERTEVSELITGLGGARGEIADASQSPGDIVVPVADVGTFALRLQVDGRWFGGPGPRGDAKDVTPEAVMVTGRDTAEVVVDLDDAAITRTLEELARTK